MTQFNLDLILLFLSCADSNHRPETRCPARLIDQTGCSSLDLRRSRAHLSPSNSGDGGWLPSTGQVAEAAEKQLTCCWLAMRSQPV